MTAPAAPTTAMPSTDTWQWNIDPSKQSLQANNEKMTVATVFGTNWYPTRLVIPGREHEPEVSDARRKLKAFHEVFDMRWFQDHYEIERETAPRVVGHVEITDLAHVKVLRRTKDDRPEQGTPELASSLGVAGVRIWFFYVSSGQMVPALIIQTDVTNNWLEHPETEAEVDRAINLLTACYRLEVWIDEMKLEDFIRERASEITILHPQGSDADGKPVARLTRERYQLVVAGGSPAAPGVTEPPSDNDVTSPAAHRLIARLLFRSRTDLDIDDKGGDSIRFPIELNRSHGAFVAVGPYVTLMRRKDPEVEHTALASVIDAIGCADRIREIHAAASDILNAVRLEQRRFRDERGETAAPGEKVKVKWLTMGQAKHKRIMLEGFADRLGDAHLELGATVESVMERWLLTPSLRVGTFHDELFEATGLRRKSESVGNLLAHIQRGIDAEMLTVENATKVHEAEHTTRWTQAVGAMTIFALPLTLWAAFFGMNAKVTNGNEPFSLHDWNKLWYLYVAGGLAALVGIAALAVIWSAQMFQRRQIRLRSHMGDDLRPFTVLPLPRSGDDPAFAARTLGPTPRRWFGIFG